MKAIAMAGKGGTGKTTVAGLVVKYLVEGGKKPVLCVDADPNSNLGEILGVSYDTTVISTVDKIMEKKEDLPAGITKARLLDFELQDAIIESAGFDMLVMGRTEGPGCYCYANDLLRKFMGDLSENYSYMVMDNEAGMEHLSRRTTRNVDILMTVANPTAVSLKSAARIHETAQGLKLGIKKSVLLINEIGVNLPGFEQDLPMELGGKIPYDEEVARAAVKGTPVFDFPPDSPAVRAVNSIMEKLGI